MTQPRREATSADRVPLREVMSRNLICARPDLDVAAVVRLVIKHHVGCIPVVDERHKPIGMITKFDLVEQLDATMQSLSNGSPLPQELAPRTADDLMMPLALTLDEHATVAQAAAMMSLEDLHHVLVTGCDGVLVGVVSSKDLVDWIVRNDGLARN